MVRDKTLLRRRVNTKRVTLLDSRKFYARYERVSRRNLPANAPKKEQEQSHQDNNENKNNEDQDFSVLHLN